MRRLSLFALLAAALAPATAHAQVPAAAAEATRDAQTADTTLAPYLGAWQISVASTPMGDVGGALTVTEDGTGFLSLTEMKVLWAPVTNVHLVGRAFVGSTSFFSSVSGLTHTGTITLAPTGGGTLSGTIADGSESYTMTAWRAAP